MLAYAPRPEAKRLRPATLGLIVLGHAGLLALVISARSEVVPDRGAPPTEVTLIQEPEAPPPPPPPTASTEVADPPISTITTVRPIIAPPLADGPTIPANPQPLPPLDQIAGTRFEEPMPPAITPPVVRTGPRFVTTGEDIRPPYPVAMRENEEEASLRLRLSIDERGRVVAVEPVGRADPTFLAAARRHILRVWRYRPAMEGARAVPSTTTITLKFELGNA